MYIDMDQASSVCRSAAELDRGNGDVHGVDEVGLQELPDDGNAAPEPYVLPISGVPGPLQRLRGCGIEEVERGVGQREARSVVVGKDKHGRVEGRGVSPPTLEVASEVVVQAAGSAGHKCNFTRECAVHFFLRS
jgi:hypothetical protein